MRAERNTLVREVYPHLRDYCASVGLDFQVVDMRWGVTEDSINDHSVEKLCLLEVANCQKTSVGPNFVVCISHHFYYIDYFVAFVCICFGILHIFLQI